MEREIDLKKISDGKLYTNKDMVKAGCGECQGCSDCCRGMGNSIFLDPMDIYRLTTGLECTFEDLLSTCVELQVVDGFIQPNMKMTGKEEQCPFLNEKGRCNIHAIRPGICRLFPLGRCYDGEGGFQYFLQIYECKKEPKSKVKIKNWLGVEEIGRYEVTFEYGRCRYYCFIDAVSLEEAMFIFFKNHPHINYDMVIEHMKV